MTKQALIRSLAVVALLLVPAGCSTAPAAAPAASAAATGQAVPPADVQLAFQSIARADVSPYYHSHPGEPGRVFLVRSAQEEAALGDRLWLPTQQKLAAVDYQRYFVLALFRGHFAEAGHGVQIQRVTRRGTQLVVEALFLELRPGYPVAAIVTNPHEVVQVLRDGGPLVEAEVVVESRLATPTPPPTAQAVALPFETIAQDDSTYRHVVYNGTRPLLVLVNGPQDLPRLDQWLPPATLDRVAAVDYERSFVLALFRDPQGTTGWTTTIQGVRWQAGKLVVQALLVSPYRGGAVITSPYHVVRVARQGVAIGSQTELVLQTETVYPFGTPR
jgi:hypothetical protein